LDVPICGACLAKVKRLGAIGLLALLVCTLFGWLVGVALDALGLLATTVVPLVLGFLLGLLSLYLIHELAEPGEFVNGIPRFENKRYQRLFREANGITRQDYGPRGERY
jgi:hypothetical protein